MANYFVMALAATAPDPRKPATSVLNSLLARKFNVTDYFRRVAYHDEENYFRMIGDDGQDLHRSSKSPRELLAWMLQIDFANGVVGQMASEWLTITLALCATADTFNCFVSVPFSKLKAMYREEAIDALYRLFGDIAVSMEAVGGYGMVDGIHNLLRPEAIVDRIKSLPDYPDSQAPLGMLAMQVYPLADVEALVGPAFIIYPWMGRYWILQDKDFLDIYANIS